MLPVAPFQASTQLCAVENKFEDKSWALRNSNFWLVRSLSCILASVKRAPSLTARHSFRFRIVLIMHLYFYTLIDSCWWLLSVGSHMYWCNCTRFTMVNLTRMLWYKTKWQGLYNMTCERECDSMCMSFLKHHWSFKFPVQAKRKRARTPTPGQYLGVRSIRSTREPAYSRDYERRGASSYDDPRDGSRRNGRYSPRYSPFRGGQESPYRGGGYRRERSVTPPRRSYYRSPPRRTRARSRSRSITPYYTSENHW